jgi:hypothetical protein
MRYNALLFAAAVTLLLSSSASAQYGFSSDCTEARDDAESAASDLEFSARMLQMCASNEDFSDDCSSEFYRAQSAHSDYESAVSDVQSYCD